MRESAGEVSEEDRKLLQPDIEAEAETVNRDVFDATEKEFLDLRPKLESSSLFLDDLDHELEALEKKIEVLLKAQISDARKHKMDTLEGRKDTLKLQELLNRCEDLSLDFKGMRIARPEYSSVGTTVVSSP